MKYKYIIVIILFLASCKPTPVETIWTRTEKYKILNIDPPKRFYLDLMRLSDGKIFKKVYISRRCYDMCISVGDVINIKYGRYKRGDCVYEEFDSYGIYNMVCNCK